MVMTPVLPGLGHHVLCHVLRCMQSPSVPDLAAFGSVCRSWRIASIEADDVWQRAATEIFPGCELPENCGSDYGVTTWRELMLAISFDRMLFFFNDLHSNEEHGLLRLILGKGSKLEWLAWIIGIDIFQGSLLKLAQLIMEYEGGSLAIGFTDEDDHFVTEGRTVLVTPTWRNFTQLRRMSSDLSRVREALASEFSDRCADVDPLALLERVRRMQDDLPQLRDDCQRVVALKHALITDVRASSLRTRADSQLSACTRDFEALEGLVGRWEERTGLLKAPAVAALESGQDALLRVRAAAATTASRTASASDSPLKEESSVESAVPVTPVAAQREQQAPRLKRSRTLFVPVSEEEFAGVSSTVRGRARLADVNDLYSAIFQAFNKKGQPTRHRRPLISSDTSAVGLTGEHMLYTLRSLRVIEMSKQGITLGR
eukprot:m51a1_g8972 hypothetical protein (430) ;mRNA; r:22932-24951